MCVCAPLFRCTSGSLWGDPHRRLRVTRNLGMSALLIFGGFCDRRRDRGESYHSIVDGIPSGNSLLEVGVTCQARPGIPQGNSSAVCFMSSDMRTGPRTILEGLVMAYSSSTSSSASSSFPRLPRYWYENIWQHGPSGPSRPRAGWLGASA